MLQSRDESDVRNAASEIRANVISFYPIRETLDDGSDGKHRTGTSRSASEGSLDTQLSFLQRVFVHYLLVVFQRGNINSGDKETGIFSVVTARAKRFNDGLSYWILKMDNNSNSDLRVITE